LTAADVSVCIAASIVVVLFFCLFYNRIFSVTFDESFTRASGKNAELYNMVIAVITAVIIVLAMNLVGSLLITALLIFPALSAMRVMKSFKAVIIYSAVISVVGATLGLLVSILFSTPVGATIVVVDMLVFAGNCAVGRMLGR
jgi:zinc transport system permease protein